MQLRLDVRGEVPIVRFVELREQVMPAGVDAETVKPTVPVRPLTAFTLIVDVPELPARTCVGDAFPVVIEKSTIENVIVVVV